MSARQLTTEFEKPLTSDPALSYTLPANYYLDPVVYEQEKKAIFNQNWHYIGHESLVEQPGDYLTLDIADESVFVMRGDDGQLRGFFNVCRHRAHRLLEGEGNTETIICPYHAWSYHSDGRFRHARFAREMRGFDPEEFCLPQIRVESLQGLLFVNLDHGALSFADSMAGLEKDLTTNIPRLRDLKPVERFAFSSAQGASWHANWKVVVDNYVECYHCANAHPALADLMVMDTYEHEVCKHWARQRSVQSRTKNTAYDFGKDDEVQVAAFWYLWPTTTIWMVPGSANLYVLAIMPTDHENTVFSGHRYALEETTDKRRSVYLNETLGPEDQGLCESVQRGLKSQSYNQGRFMVDANHSGTAEHGMHQFHRLVKAALG